MCHDCDEGLPCAVIVPQLFLSMPLRLLHSEEISFNVIAEATLLMSGSSQAGVVDLPGGQKVGRYRRMIVFFNTATTDVIQLHHRSAAPVDAWRPTGLLAGELRV